VLGFRQGVVVPRAEVDLEPVKAAAAALREKYPDFIFETNFEPTISGMERGCGDINTRFRLQDELMPESTRKSGNRPVFG
jgi:hypothetical protein